MKTLRAIFAHVLQHQEIYVFPLLAVALIAAALEGIPLLTGRNVQDSPAAVVGFLYNFAGIIAAALAAGIIQRHLIGYRNPDTYSTHDALCTVYLLTVFAYFIFR